MNIIVFAAWAVIFSNTSFASDYEHLNQHFLHAGNPPFSRILGWVAGWCVSKSAPDSRHGGLLTTYRDAQGKEKSVFWSDPKLPADHFMELTPQEIKEIEDGLRQWDPKIPLLIRKQKYWEAIYNDGQNTYSTRTKATRRSIVVLAFNNDAQVKSCVFFKKLR